MVGTRENCRSMGPLSLGHGIERRECRLDGIRGRLAQPTNRGITHDLTDLPEQGQLLGSTTHRPARAESPQKLFLTHRADTARDALTTRLIPEERRDAHQDVAQVDRFVKDQYDARAKRSAAARVPSKLRGISNLSGPTNVPAAPPSNTARIAFPSGTPPANAIKLPREMPKSTSKTPGRATHPETQKSLGPVDPGVPMRE